MTPGLRVWLDLAVFNEPRDTAPAVLAAKIPFMKRKKAEWALRKGRVDLLTKQRAAVAALRKTAAGRTHLRLLHTRRAAIASATRDVGHLEDERRARDLAEARRIRDLRLQHLLKLRNLSKGKRALARLGELAGKLRDGGK